MAGLDAYRGTVVAPRPGSAWVDIGGRTVLARNGLNVRTPPGSTVVIAQDPTFHTWTIIARER